MQIVGQLHQLFGGLLANALLGEKDSPPGARGALRQAPAIVEEVARILREQGRHVVILKLDYFLKDVAWRLEREAEIANARPSA